MYLKKVIYEMKALIIRNIPFVVWCFCQFYYTKRNVSLFYLLKIKAFATIFICESWVIKNYYAFIRDDGWGDTVEGIFNNGKT